ncbi:hypothetical protein PFISCL1PPCAC_496 [Pristionchus fissidentatus]|uniref:Secreted protein n=1 Tax=Pristionchus fissidentatus TaxID=1538716 RepID=A0AAV5URK8_9BILA|nr:hypothetical protein PFISCL1PPCAC_494 [Pristionchus fissidentatus]GMT09199.1 hypothetical protein PFISCL1PPCAC_496 [Pristionchus fissidentatus]
MPSLHTIVALFVIACALSFTTVSGRLQFESLRPYGSADDLPMYYGRNVPAKRSRCLINAGLSQGCDLSDILYANRQANKLASFAGPGRR